MFPKTQILLEQANALKSAAKMPNYYPVLQHIRGV
jgi:hypothetical protein